MCICAFFGKGVVVDGGFVRTAHMMSARRELKLSLKKKKFKAVECDSFLSTGGFVCKDKQTQTNTNCLSPTQ